MRGSGAQPRISPGDIVQRPAPGLPGESMLVIDTYTRRKDEGRMAVCLADGVARHFRWVELVVLARSS